MRWVYLGEDIDEGDELSTVEARMKFLETTKALNKKMVWILPVVKCNTATVKDTVWYDADLFKDKLDDCLTNKVTMETQQHFSDRFRVRRPRANVFVCFSPSQSDCID